MAKQVYKIDENGYYIEPVILEKEQEIPNDCVEVRPPQPCYKPRWAGEEWVEEGNPPEPQPKPRTQLEILQETVDMLVLDNLEVL